MGQVNVRMTRQPENLPRRTTTILLAVLIGMLIPLVVAAGTLVALRQNGREVVVTRVAVLATQTAQALAVNAAPAQATATATARGTGTAAPPASPATLPVNPTGMQVTAGSCGRRLLSWSWTGAQGATGYDVVLYNPATGRALAQDTTLEPRFTQVGVPGEVLGLKVRARNDAGRAPGYFSPPRAVAGVPPQTTNPTDIMVSNTGAALIWRWSGASGATRYAVVRYHYAGNRVVVDQQGEVTGASLSAPASGTTVYYLKIRSLGQCAPSTWYTPGPASANHQ